MIEEIESEAKIEFIIADGCEISLSVVKTNLRMYFEIVAEDRDPLKIKSCKNAFDYWNIIVKNFYKKHSK